VNTHTCAISDFNISSRVSHQL